MTTWKYEVNIKDLLDVDEPTDADANRIGVTIAARLTQAFSARMEDDTQLEDIVQAMEEIADVEDFDNILENLYDYADAEGIWLGGR